MCTDFNFSDGFLFLTVCWSCGFSAGKWFYRNKFSLPGQRKYLLTCTSNTIWLVKLHVIVKHPVFCLHSSLRTTLVLFWCWQIISLYSAWNRPRVCFLVNNSVQYSFKLEAKVNVELVCFCWGPSTLKKWNVRKVKSENLDDICQIVIMTSYFHRRYRIFPLFSEYLLLYCMSVCICNCITLKDKSGGVF